MAGFCFFFQLSSLALIRESLTGPVWEMGMQEMKKDLSSPASLVTAFFRGLSSKRPAVHKPETKVDKDCEIETSTVFKNPGKILKSFCKPSIQYGILGNTLHV